MSLTEEAEAHVLRYLETELNTTEKELLFDIAVALRDLNWTLSRIGDHLLNKDV